VFFRKYYWGHEMRKDNVDGACCARGGEEKYIKNFGWET
jgi:hypothetical protein